MNKFFLLAFSFLSFSTFFSQNIQANGLQTFFVQDTIKLKAGQSFSNIIQLYNRSSVPIKIDSIRPVQNFPGLLFSPSFDSEMQPNESQELKIRMIASKELLSSSFSSIQYWVYSQIQGQQQKQKISFSLLREKMDFVTITTLGELYFNPLSPENSLRFFVENQSYAPKVARIKLKLIPDDFVTLFPEEQIVQLNSREKQMITVQLRKRQSLSYYPDYNLSVQVFDDAQQNSISTVILPIRSLSSYRMVNYDGHSPSYKNFVETSYNNTDNSNNYYKVRANYETKLNANTKIGINTTTDYYTDTKNVAIYDTRLDIHHANISVGIGNIYGQDYDFNISGRGVKVSAKLDEKNHLELLGLDNNYMLYSDFSNGFATGKTAGIKYNFRLNKNKSTQVNYVYNQNNFSKVNSQIINARLPIYSDSLQVFSLELGLSQENLSSDLHQLGKRGCATGINYAWVGSKLTFNSNNYFSTPYYSGIRRGSLFLDELLNYRLSDKNNFYFRYNSSVNQTGYFNDMDPNGYTENSKFKNYLLEAGWSWNGRSIRFSAAPNYAYQYINTPYNLLEYKAYRMRFSLGKSINRHQISLSWDGGLSQINASARDIWAQRMVFNYSFGIVNLSGMVDINPNNAYDLTWYQEGTFVNYSTSLGMRILGLRKRLNGYLNLGYSYINTQKTDNFYWTSNLDYKISPSWSLTSMVYYNFNRNAGLVFGDSFINSNLQVKIGVKLALGSSNTGNKLSLRFYEDDNLNQKIDRQESVISNAIVKLNDHIYALTNDKGMVKFANLKEGDYTISISKNNQRIPLMGLEKITVNQNKQLDIPVVKTITLQGKLVEIKEKYDVQQADFMGINIYAQNVETKKVTVVVTEIDGSFVFQLTEGKYQLYIQNDRYEILNNQQEVTINQHDAPIDVIFNFKNKELKIRKKQF